MEFIGRNMWLLVPIQGKIKEFSQDFDQYPYQPGSTLNASGISYTWLQQQAALKRARRVGRVGKPGAALMHFVRARCYFQ
ncbi:hypothetical protein [Sinorhizobium meliloti]|uniref:hypothetical protein n=1 Tax=Rhizobium meliloti TaxID=382 RepID=UPI003DA0B25D